jgi:hypothetical protein
MSLALAMMRFRMLVPEIRSLLAGGAFAGRALVVVGCAASLGCGSAELGVPEAEEAEPLTYVDCGTAPRDAVLTGYASQVGGVTSPKTFDNPGCDDYYIVEYDGTVNGVHYGYRAATPTSTAQGITLSFKGLTPPNPSSYSPSICGDSFAQAFLYEKQSNGTWQYVTSKLFAGQGSHVAGSPGQLYSCGFPTMRFSEVVKGTAAAPHIYRVAATEYVISHDAAYQAAFPDTVGYGPIQTYAQE